MYEIKYDKYSTYNIKHIWLIHLQLNLLFVQRESLKKVLMTEFTSCSTHNSKKSVSLQYYQTIFHAECIYYLVKKLELYVKININIYLLLYR